MLQTNDKKKKWEVILTGGEDYKLLFSIRKNKKKYLKNKSNKIKKIGFFSKGSGVEIYDINKKKMLRNLRTHIQRAEVQHGKLVSLRRAYNELLLGGGHWQKRYDASGNPFWKHTITKQIVYSDPQARFVQEVVPRNRHAEAMIKGRTHHRDTESPFDPPLSATASSIVHGPPPVTRQVSRDDVSAAHRAPELRAEVEVAKYSRRPRSKSAQ